jgi:nitrous oxide reductase
MANYQEILGDKARMNRAIKEANKQARDLSKRASVMQNAAKVKTTKTTTGRKK